MITIIVSHLHIKNENISFCSSLNIIITKFLNTHCSILGTCVSIHHGKYKENHLLTLYMQYTKFLYSVLHHLYKTMLWQNPHMPIVGNIVTIIPEWFHLLYRSVVHAFERSCCFFTYQFFVKNYFRLSINFEFYKLSAWSKKIIVYW